MKILRRSILSAIPFLVFVPLAAARVLAPLSFTDDGDEKDESADEEEDRWFAITNADIYTGTGEVLRGAAILSHNGVIEEIGYDLYLPEETEILDAMGMRVYPGLVALGATSTITQPRSFEAEQWGVFPEEEMDLDLHGGLDDPHGEEPEGDGIEELVQGIASHLIGPGDGLTADGEVPYGAYEGMEAAAARHKLEDGFDPFSQNLILALSTGITTADQSGAAMKLRRGEIEGVMLKAKNQASMSWSVSNPSAIRSLRKKFQATSAYLRDYREWDALSDKEKKEVKEPRKPDGYDPSVLAVLRGELLARFTASTREDLLGIARLAQTYHFRPVIWGCREGWTVAEELGRAGALAVVTPRERSPKDEKLVRPGGSSIENAAILHAHGVQVAIKPANASFNLGGITGRDLLHFPVEAAFGVRGGLPEDAALASITLIPARILGVDHRIGTLEVGKDMDAIVTDGDVLHYETFVQWTVVSGKVVYDKQKEVLYAHIRPRPEPQKEETEAQQDGAEDGAEATGGSTSEDEQAEAEDADSGDEPGDDSEDEDEPSGDSSM